MSLRGRVALVTGVSRRAGIGFAIASRLQAAGADLVLHALPPCESGLSDAVEADFEDEAAPARVVAEAVRRHGHVDILVANHAHSSDGVLEVVDAASIDRHLHVNVRATVLLIREFAAQHDGRPGGRVILLTSGQNRGPMAGEIAYAASKGALVPITISLAHHLAPRGITVNAVDPGATDTGWASAALHAEILAREPMGRWGEPDDAARLVAWLASDDARWITGQVIHSTGGGP